MGLYKYLEPAILGRILHRKVVLSRTREGRSSGLHAASSRGEGTAFLQHREYVIGDDIKSVDWRLSARRDHIYVKEFESETSLTGLFLLDGSSSMEYSSSPDTHTKFEYAQRLISHLAIFFLNQRDRVAMMQMKNERQRGGRDVSRPVNSAQVIEQIALWKCGGMVSLEESFSMTRHTGQGKTLCFFFSDFVDPLFLDHDAHRVSLPRHGRVTLIRINDVAEISFPFRKFRRFMNPETGKGMLMDPRRVKSMYNAAYEKHSGVLVDYCNRSGSKFVSISSSDPLELSLEAILDTAGVR